MSEVEKKKNKKIETERIIDPEVEPCQAPAEARILDISHLRLVHGNNFGTSFNGVVSAPPICQDDTILAQETWLREVAAEADLSAVDLERLLSSGKQHLQTAVVDFNSLEHVTGRDLTRRAIRMGVMIIGLKKLVKQKKEKWGAWASENLPFLGERNRQKYTQLGSRLDAHKYDFLGIERLYMLCVATDSYVGKEEDPIGNFLSRHNVAFDQNTDFDIDDFKRDIDVAMNMDLLSSKGIQGVDPALVKNLSLAKVRLDGSLMGELKTLQNYGGNINDRLRDLSQTRGKIRDLEEKEKTRNFNTLSIQLLKATEAFLKDREKMETINTNLFMDLFKRLDVLRQLLVPETSEKAAVV
ncbi:MAG: hypothetical protein ACLP9S_04790 [Syntrophales bacterium]